MVIKRIGVVWFYVSQWNRAIDFYTRTLGLKLRFESPNTWAELAVGDGPTLLGLRPWPGATGDGRSTPVEVPRHGGATVMLEVDGLRAHIDEPTRRGIHFVSGREGHDADGVREIPDHGWLATFHDPDGNRLQLFQPAYR